ncbi:Cytochrome c [Dyadobacter koreensis]|uniref:Cytochrome c n=1 Tax=Dyadobacter koreensis TaxID=408657 RepID=A0A1H6Z9H0_9BACT|nr:cytochrome c [Dyadobacter koreensis]SEJ49376.1 Cytochrome c [Dyadobacter koreensis]
MFSKIIKWSGIVVGSLALILSAVYAYIYYDTESRAKKIYDVKLQSLTVLNDSISIAKGKHIAEIRGCTGCHGMDLSGGMAFADEQSPIGILYSSNITSGNGGINYTDQDWIRALRHGLGKDGRSLWFMPSHEIYHISNQDMASLISFVKSRPPVDKVGHQKSLKPLGRVLTFLDEFPLFPAEKINHNAVYVDDVAPSSTPEYGEYLAITCTGCHSPTLKGAAPHGPNEPPVPDISSTGNLGKWTLEGFATTIRTGKTPDGKQLSDAMPWRHLTYTDQELNAIYSYLHGLP